MGSNDMPENVRRAHDFTIGSLTQRDFPGDAETALDTFIGMLHPDWNPATDPPLSAEAMQQLCLDFIEGTNRAIARWKE